MLHIPRFLRRLNVLLPNWGATSVGAAFLIAAAVATGLVQSVVFGTVGSGLVLYGLLNREPKVTVERQWNDDHDRLRRLVRELVALVDTRWGEYATSLGPDWPDSWKDYARKIPIPYPDRRPLCGWEDRLTKFEGDAVQRFLAFARRLDSRDTERIGAYRQEAIRIYNDFGYLEAAKPRVFSAWMDDAGLAVGAEDVVVLLAYLEVAAACRLKFGGAGDVHDGFWRLAERWHPHVIRLAQPHPS